MEGITLVLTIGGIIIGAVASYLASGHFFKKSVKKKTLTPYIQFTSRLFSELDPELKDNLIVRYKDLKIENITQAQFLIANTGDVPVRDIIEPLRLKLPKDNNILGINLLHIEPEGRSISFKVIDSEIYNIIEFQIPLLNGGEFFVFKLILQDTLPKSDKEEKTDKKTRYEFTITADDLPPKLEIEPLPFSYYEETKKKSYDWTGIWIGLTSLIISTSIIGTIYSFKFKTNGLYLIEFKDFFSSETFGLYNIFILISGLIGLIFLIISVIGFVGSLTDLKPDKKPKFKVPNKLRKERNFHPFELFE